MNVINVVACTLLPHVLLKLVRVCTVLEGEARGRVSGGLWTFMRCLCPFDAIAPVKGGANASCLFLY